MSDLRALWFDGVSAEARAVAVTVDGDSIWLLGDSGWQVGLTRADLSLLTPPSAPRPVLRTARGEQLVLPDAGSVGRLADPPAHVPWAEAASRSNAVALLAVAALAGLVFVALGWLVPNASELVAAHLPKSAEVRLRAEVLRVVDRSYFRPSSLSADEKKRIRGRFDVLAVAADVNGVRLEFRDGAAIGANAVAIPGGVVIVTDQLVDLLGESHQLDAVLAHELGHIHHRHALRALVSRTGFSLVIATLLLDQGLLQRVAEFAPQALLNAANSRGAEREADAFAARLLLTLGRTPQDFADAIARLEQQRGNPAITSGYFTSHPSSAERVDAATKAK